MSKGVSRREASFRASEMGGKTSRMGLGGDDSEVEARVLMRVRAAMAWSPSCDVMFLEHR